MKSDSMQFSIQTNFQPIANRKCAGRQCKKKERMIVKVFFSLQVLKLIIFEFMEGSRRSIRKKGPAHIQLGLSAMSIVFKLPTKIRYNLQSFMGLGAHSFNDLRTPHFVKIRQEKCRNFSEKWASFLLTRTLRESFKERFILQDANWKSPKR